MQRHRASRPARMGVGAALGVVAVACGSLNNGAPSGGSSGASSNSSTAGGSSSAAPPASCSNVTACGGNVVGTWNVASSCLKLMGTMDPSMFGLTCTSASVTGGTLQVSGTWTANADGTYADNTTTSGSEKFTLPPECLQLSGTTTTCDGVAGPLRAAFSDVTCTSAGGGCDCTGTVQQSGGMGLVTAGAPTSGSYTPSGNTITLTGGFNGLKYSYCVSGNTITLTPQDTATSGTVVAQMNGASSSSGSGGSSGSTSGGSSSTGSSSRSSSSSGSGSTATNAGMGPCDVYATGGAPCAAAYSMIRTLSSKYTGPLYQVRAGSSTMNTGTGGTGTKDITQTADGYADTTVEDAFCAGTVCTVSILYDQSGNGNDLKSAPAGLSNGGAQAAKPDFESSANKLSLTAGGHKVYPLYMNMFEGYRTALGVKGKNMPVGNTPQGIYELVDGTHFGTACCWDFGNVTTDPTQYHTMNTLFFGTGFWGKGAGNGPWFEADVEGGVWAGGAAVGDPGGSNGATRNTSDPTMAVSFAFGTVKTSSGKYEIRSADAATATDLTTAYNGTSPVTWDNQGGIVLGVGGDNSNNSFGTFYEGAITAGMPTDATDLSVLKNVQAVGYKK
jgi:non-reducing end alpha-L-arabinofuranosidase